jgi:hypothetical protein
MPLSMLSLKPRAGAIRSPPARRASVRVVSFVEWKLAPKSGQGPALDLTGSIGSKR